MRLQNNPISVQTHLWTEHEQEKQKTKPNPRKFPFDMIYTFHDSTDVSCCIAVRAGLKYGIRSDRSLGRLCPYTNRFSGTHKVVFVDNEYFHYDHATHLAAVKELRPKYATVRDVMTQEQCLKDNIEWYSIEQILEWAEELSEYAQNVIVIPKYDCLDHIPEKFMFGYSIPTSYGGTPLPIQMFAGRRVHLLGGSWKAQLAHMAMLDGDVVSADTNQIHFIASKFGQFVLPNGETRSLTQAGFTALSNPRYVAFTLSVGAIAAKLHELYTQDGSMSNE